VQYALDGTNIETPQASDFITWANTALAGRKNNAELTIRIVNENEITDLNNRYRHKNSPTNVLSFPAEYANDIPVSLIGDVVICAPVVIKEAKDQQKDPIAHWAHLTIHGTLHLLGYDHINEQDAKKMESTEIALLKQLGFTNPYTQDTRK